LLVLQKAIPYKAPMPEGVFDSLEEAEAALTEKGAVAGLE
jgi:hypothetical protein